MPAPFSLTPHQLEEFDLRGVVRLPGFYAAADIGQMADRLWADLEQRFGMRRDAPATWTTIHPGKFQPIERAGAFNALGSPALVGLIDAMLGTGRWVVPPVWGSPLVTFPTPAPTLRRPPWHLDIEGNARLDPLPNFRFFTFLEPVLPGGGGTLYVAGSHRLALEIDHAKGAPVRSAEIRNRLKADHPWFADLFGTLTAGLPARMNVEAEIGGHRVALAEMCGGAGDLIIMHPGIMHALAHNSRSRPRLMLRGWIPRIDK